MQNNYINIKSMLSFIMLAICPILLDCVLRIAGTTCEHLGRDDTNQYTLCSVLSASTPGQLMEVTGHGETRDGGVRLEVRVHWLYRYFHYPAAESDYGRRERAVTGVRH